MKNAYSRVGPSFAGRLLPALVIVSALAADAVASRAPDEIKQARARVESTGNAVRSTLSRRTGISVAERDVLADVKFVYSPSQLPSVQAIRQFGQRTVLVSDGWMSLVEDLTRAELLARSPRTPECFHLFARTVLSTARANLSMTRLNPRAPPLVLPRFAEYVEDRSNVACTGIRSTDLRAAGIARAVRTGVDAALWWVIGRELALQFDPRDVDLPSSIAAEIAQAVSAAAAKATSPGGNATSSAHAPFDAEGLSRKLTAEAIANELRCRAEFAEVRAVDRALSARIDVAAGFMAVLAHEVIFDRDGDGAVCAGGKARLLKLFDSLRVDGAAGTIQAKERAIETWEAIHANR